MKSKLKNIVITLLLSICVIPMFGIGVFATGTDTLSTSPTQTISSNGTLSTNSPNINSPELRENEDGGWVMDSNITNVSMDKATNWANRKGFDVVKFLQTIVQPLAIIVFIISGFVAMIGSFGRGGFVGKGLLGMGISIVMYTGVLFAPEIIQFFSQWLST